MYTSTIQAAATHRGVEINNATDRLTNDISEAIDIFTLVSHGPGGSEKTRPIKARKMDNEKDLLTATELASMLQCSVKTIKHKTASRQIPAVRFGRSWVYPRQAVIEALNEAARREADEQNRQIFIVPRGRGKRVRPVLI